ncbi:hypothetical protein [Agromyces bauzanensis]|uniref:hypothetical protein n=1 Tax=Agromyces bauzanensis TaxID=1308924 RepID=UPI0016641039|nr:hypothetical protein [Agromyces bauzanensis]
MARLAPLNDKQLAVLRWVAEGRPKGVYDERFDHRITARALQRRGLLEVRGHGATWRAAVTTDGEYYLAHGDFRPTADPEPPPQRSKAAKVIESQPEPIDDLFERLDASGGSMRIEQPTPRERISIRRAVDQARSAGDLPPHQRLRMSGTKQGPLIVELLTVAAPATERQIPVPQEPNARHPEIRALLANRSLLSVSEEQLPRALALVQAVADECRRRGWILEVDDKPTFVVAVGEDSYRFMLGEEREKRDVYAEEDVAARKYDWQRVSPTRREVFNGRLRLELGVGYALQWWADRKRWTLADKLPDVFDVVDQKASAARLERKRRDDENTARLHEWEEAIPRAREQYARMLNAERAVTQAEAWNRATQLRAYADAAAHRAEQLEEELRTEALGWADWIRGEANRLDPLLDTSALRMEAPESAGPRELDPFMPHHWTVSASPRLLT